MTCGENTSDSVHRGCGLRIAGYMREVEVVTWLMLACSANCIVMLVCSGNGVVGRGVKL